MSFLPIFTQVTDNSNQMLKHFWENTFLGSLFKSDPLYAKGLSFILVVYLFIHIFRLELFPMYMFAMFSKQETPKELYHTYKLYDQEQEINLQDWDFRKYTVFMNTIIQFDDILSNEMIHPESQAIDKFVGRLQLKNSKIHTILKERFHYTKDNIVSSTGKWVSEQLDISKENLRIEKVSYSWNNALPQFEHKATIYGMDK